MAYEPDNRQLALRHGQVVSVGEPWKGGEYADKLRHLTIREPDGTLRDVIFHPELGRSVVRLRKELATY